ncbi:hypothetical protein KGD83_00350 [Nocardiopsis akebiae]|uniref:Uncharacterized protein n=1 Tax=Nocardiopsis akebiae TaxID=2831968 RepID=A0ABX8C3Z6_9ACTN|nr:hypothetical protein [Nocardiopsis akebiae]QUX29102.1 hypothetical protein KGD83_00350 [Nocardiopsis akebiae]
MSRPLSTRYALVYPDYGIFQIIDCAQDEPDAPLPGHDDFSVGKHSVFLRSFQTNLRVRLDLESWRSEPPALGGEWEADHTTAVTLPSGVIGVSELTYGSQHNLLTLPAPGRYRIRIAHRNRRLVSEAYMALFDRFGDIRGAGFAAAKRDLEGREQYLAQFWPEP